VWSPGRVTLIDDTWVRDDDTVRDGVVYRRSSVKEEGLDWEESRTRKYAMWTLAWLKRMGNE
jgi:hypothetical protein